MPVLPGGLSADQIRILQEFRVRQARELTLTQIEAVRHPGGSRPDALPKLVEWGYLTQVNQDTFGLAPKGDELLSVNHQPLYERG